MIGVAGAGVARGTDARGVVSEMRGGHNTLVPQGREAARGRRGAASRRRGEDSRQGGDRAFPRNGGGRV